MSMVVKWTDGALKQHETRIEDWRICEKIAYCDYCYASEIPKMCLNEIVKEGIMSIDETWYEDD